MSTIDYSPRDSAGSIIRTGPEDEEVTRELRSLGAILSPVSPEQRRQLDTIGALRPTIKKQSRRAKKSARRKE